DEAALSGGSCAPFPAAWSPVTLSGGSDTTVQSGKCYRYRLRISDRVGNEGTQAGTSATVKVDTSAPPAPALSFSGLSNASVTGHGTAPVTTIACDGTSCAGWHTAAQDVTLAATDGGAGVDHMVYTTDGSDPTAGGGTTYSGPFSVSSSATVRFAAYDKVGNVESVQSQAVDVDATPPSPPSLAFSGFTNASESGGTVFFRPGATGGFTVTPT